MKEFWNERYSAATYAYGKEPNKWFSKEIKKLTPGRILLPCEGEGRNAVFAAQCGWDVHCFDFSIEGKKKALKLADEKGVKINYELSAAEDFKTENNSYDCITLIYTHFEPEFKKAFLGRIYSWLKPGAVLIMEVFSKRQISNNSGGPKNFDRLYSIEELKELLQDLSIITLSEITEEIQEGSYHSGDSEIIRLIAQKPL